MFLHAVAAHRLAGYLGGQFGFEAGIQHRDALSRIAVLWQRSPGLTHEPHGQTFRPTTLEGGQKGRLIASCHGRILPYHQKSGSLEPL